MLGTIALDSKPYRFGSLQYKTQKINLEIFNCIYWSKICSLFLVLKNIKNKYKASAKLKAASVSA